MNTALGRSLGGAAAVVALLGGGALSTAAAAPAPADPGSAPAAIERFTMVRSSGAVNAGCLQGAGATVRVEELGTTEKMTIKAHDLPPATEFDLFVIQDPDAPFGISWYQSDMRSDQSGNASVVVKGRFNEETVTLATGVTDAPVTHDDPPFPDADANPQFAPVHMYHLGLWFNSPADAAEAGCPSTVTPFNGDHTAGIQALSTRNFPADEGPLGNIG